MRFGKVVCCLSNNPSNSCFCINFVDAVEEEEERESLAPPMNGESQAPKQTLAFHLKPKTVVLKVSIHCHGCARKVEKHISKMEGVTSYKVDLETKMVVVIGDVLPGEVVETICKVKKAQLWTAGI